MKGGTIDEDTEIKPDEIYKIARLLKVYFIERKLRAN